MLGAKHYVLMKGFEQREIILAEMAVHYNLRVIPPLHTSPERAHLTCQTFFNLSNFQQSTCKVLQSQFNSREVDYPILCSPYVGP